MMAYRTLGELVASLRAYVGNDTSTAKAAACKRAALSGLRNLLTYHEWAYYQAISRVVTVAPYDTGTIAYDHTGGSSERLVTLSGGTFPDWAAFGLIKIGTVYHEIASRLSGTTLSLESWSNPGADVAAGTTYSLVRVTYPLPADFLASDQFIVAGFNRRLVPFAPRDAVLSRNLDDGPGEPREFAFLGSAAKDGKLAVTVNPAPDQAYPLEFLYKRRPAVPTLEEEAAGRVAVTADSAVVTGTGTAFGWSAPSSGCRPTPPSPRPRTGRTRSPSRAGSCRWPPPPA
jgi:hypothetical protein